MLEKVNEIALATAAAVSGHVAALRSAVGGDDERGHKLAGRRRASRPSGGR
jgi:hypothetical protein